MKIFHLSDLHIGKQLNGYSLKENQTRILRKIVEYARDEHPDAILICGDIYDKSTPSGEAYVIFDRFLDALSEIRPEIPILIIAGNHDSPERLAYASSFLEKHHIYLSVFPPRNEQEYLKKITLQDEHGPVAFYLLPFMKPGYVRPLWKNAGSGDNADEEDDGKNADQSALTYEAAVRMILAREKIDDSIRNVILSHQFYTAGDSQPDTCDSETAVLMAGGLDRINASVLDRFDYAALGHLHGSQQVGTGRVRYCGTPYKYSVSEEHHRKAVTVVTLGAKGSQIQLKFLPLQDEQDVRRVRGSLSEVLAAAPSVCHDYVSITITDEEDSYRVRETLEEVYDHMLELRVDNARTRLQLSEEAEEELQELQPMEAFRLFYETVRGEALSSEETQIMEKLISEAKEESI